MLRALSNGLRPGALRLPGTRLYPRIRGARPLPDPELAELENSPDAPKLHIAPSKRGPHGRLRTVSAVQDRDDYVDDPAVYEGLPPAVAALRRKNSRRSDTDLFKELRMMEQAMNAEKIERSAGSRARTAQPTRQGRRAAISDFAHDDDDDDEDDDEDDVPRRKSAMPPGVSVMKRYLDPSADGLNENAAAHNRRMQQKLSKQSSHADAAADPADSRDRALATLGALRQQLAKHKAAAAASRSAALGDEEEDGDYLDEDEYMSRRTASASASSASAKKTSAADRDRVRMTLEKLRDRLQQAHTRGHVDKSKGHVKNGHVKNGHVDSDSDDDDDDEGPIGRRERLASDLIRRTRSHVDKNEKSNTGHVDDDEDNENVNFSRQRLANDVLSRASIRSASLDRLATPAKTRHPLLGTSRDPSGRRSLLDAPEDISEEESRRPFSLEEDFSWGDDDMDAYEREEMERKEAIRARKEKGISREEEKEMIKAQQKEVREREGKGSGGEVEESTW